MERIYLGVIQADQVGSVLLYAYTLVLAIIQTNYFERSEQSRLLRQPREIESYPTVEGERMGV